MYINRIRIESFRTFRQTAVDFVHPDQDAKRLGFPAKPRLNNVNLLLGNNGSGKTSLLKAVAIAALGPAVAAASLPIYRLIRREPGETGDPGTGIPAAVIEADFTPHAQEVEAIKPVRVKRLESHVTIQRRGDVELPVWTHPDDKPWHPIFSAANDAFFFVGYGATRRVESTDRVDPSSRSANTFVRAQRIRSLFEEAYSLVPLPVWIPHLNKGRLTQVKNLINRLLKGTGYTFTGEQEQAEYLFEREGLRVPFPALSDGYRAYLGWISDLLYHVNLTCPSGKKLVENRGIVMVDEIDLHLHPQWQMTVLPTLAGALPNLQFIVTSHSPLVVGSLEWMNILLMAPEDGQASQVLRIPEPVHGLDADQVLLTDFFGLESTRAPGKDRELKDLSLKASEGDAEAALELLKAMSRGGEAES